MPESNRVLLVGISGPSSSGKTTLSRLLRDILNASPAAASSTSSSTRKVHALVLHEDDFYKPDDDIPVGVDGLRDWDCLEAIDLPALERVLLHVKQHGAPPADFTSKEDQNSVGEVPISREAREQCAELAVAAISRRAGEEEAEVTVAIVDGFLLYSLATPQISSLLDLRLFLRTSYATAKERRGARSGYVTLGGFWEDPPGYVDKIVWPNYVREHAYLFRDGNVEGPYDEGALRRMGLKGMPKEMEGNLGRCLEWVVSEVCGLLGSVDSAEKVE